MIYIHIYIHIYIYIYHYISMYTYIYIFYYKHLLTWSESRSVKFLNVYVIHAYIHAKRHWNGKGLKDVKSKMLGQLPSCPSICFRGGGWPGTNEDIITALERIAQLPESELSEPEYRDLGREVIISKSLISPRFCCSFADGWCFFFGKPPKIEVGSEHPHYLDGF